MERIYLNTGLRTREAPPLQSWSMWPGKRKSGVPCLSCPHDLTSDKRSEDEVEELEKRLTIEQPLLLEISLHLISALQLFVFPLK